MNIPVMYREFVWEKGRKVLSEKRQSGYMIKIFPAPDSDTYPSAVIIAEDKSLTEVGIDMITVDCPVSTFPKTSL